MTHNVKINSVAFIVILILVHTKSAKLAQTSMNTVKYCSLCQVCCVNSLASNIGKTVHTTKCDLQECAKSIYY